MNERPDGPGEGLRIVTVGPDGAAVDAMAPMAIDDGDDDATPITEMVEQPAKVMRIGTMIKQLLEEVHAAPLDDASRARLPEIHQSPIKGLAGGLAPELG